jgi:hypothetical protein
VQGFFHDTGEPYDPPAGVLVTSRNVSSARLAPESAPDGAVATIDAHGDAGAAWDATMRAVGTR